MSDGILLAIVDWSVRATLVVIAVAFLLFLFRFKNVQIRLRVWTTVLAGLILMPALTWLMNPLPIWLPAESIPATGFAVQSAPLRVTVGTSTRIVESSHSSGASVFLIGCWLAVSFGFLTRIGAGLRMAARVRKAALPLGEDLAESSVVRVPVTVGLWKPTILLPSDWREWESETLAAVLAHERSHVGRRDPLRQFVASVFRSIAWFHPLAWWLRGELIELAELASDDAATTATADPVRYAEFLVCFIERAQNRVRLEGVAMASAKTRAKRFQRLLDANHVISKPPGKASSLGVTLVLLPAIYLCAVLRPERVEAQSLDLAPPRVALAPQVAVPSAAKSLCGGSKAVENAYGGWLNQVAVYIITEPERRRFSELQTEKQCQDFIASFWESRGPDAKVEHYRRISYSNDRFRGRRPGWTTDRGRIYITHGPPYEIESHPSGGKLERPAEEGGGVTATFPFEIWHYPSIPTLGEDVRFLFVDKQQNGDYALAMTYDQEGTKILKAPPGRPR